MTPEETASKEQFEADIRERMSQPGSKGADEPLRFPRRARPERMRPASSVRKIHAYIAEAGVTIDDVMRPEFLLPVSRQLAVWDRIEIMEEAGAFVADFVVLSVSQDGVRLSGWVGKELGGQLGVRDAALRTIAGGTIHYRGPHRMWSVELGDRVLRDELPTESDAMSWLGNYSRARKP